MITITQLSPNRLPATVEAGVPVAGAHERQSVLAIVDISQRPMGLCGSSDHGRMHIFEL